jgi:ABC-type Fe3+-siderophore transport system permease subunit
VSIKAIKITFAVAAFYDGFFGFLGIFAPNIAFDLFDVVPPNHPVYVQFPSILLLIFGAMFYQVARNPVMHRDLMLYGIALKVGYSGSVFFHQLTTGIPAMWVPWAWIDLVFLVLFLLSWRATGSDSAPVGQPKPT